MRRRRLALACTMVALVGMPVQAETPQPTSSSLAGTWTITVRDPGCSFSGQATVRPADTGYTADLVMRHDCPFFADGAITAVQESEISLNGEQISVRSKIVDFPATGWRNTYAPDHFALTATSPTRLYGIQSDRYGTRPAEWVRAASGIS